MKKTTALFVFPTAVFPALVLSLLLSGFLFACGSEQGKKEDAAEKTKGAEEKRLPNAETPEQAYAQLVSAVKTGNYGAMYDLMDSANRNYTKMWFELNLSQLDQMDSVTRAGWAQFRNITDPRKRFIRLVEVTPPMRERFVDGYKVVSVDTVVAVVTESANSSPQLTYFRWEDGGYKYTAPPESKIAPAAMRVSQQTPPKEESTPDGANKR